MESSNKNNSVKTESNIDLEKIATYFTIKDYFNKGKNMAEIYCNKCNKWVCSEFDKNAQEICARHIISCVKMNKNEQTVKANLYLASSSNQDLSLIKSIAARLKAFGAECYPWWDNINDIKELDFFSRFRHGDIDLEKIINCDIFWWINTGTEWSNSFYELGIAIGYNQNYITTDKVDSIKPIHIVVSGDDSVLRCIFLNKVDKVFIGGNSLLPKDNSKTAHELAEMYIKEWLNKRV